MKILVTGANGFIGSSLISHLCNDKRFEVVGTARSESAALNAAGVEIRICNLCPTVDLELDLSDVDVLIHTAGLAHVRPESALHRNEFEAINTDGTLNLANKAAASGVKRFIYLSSIKAVGDSSPKDKPLTPHCLEQPQDPYGISKLKAENGLHKVASLSQLEVTIIRPPLVYGAGVKGNLQTLVSLLKRGVPLPFGSLKDNQRSMVSLTNLISLLTVCIDSPHAVNRTFNVSDGEDLSTAELINRLGIVMGRPARLFPCSEAALLLISRILKIEDKMQKITGSLQVDITETIQALNWRPVSSSENDLKFTVLSNE